MYLYILFTSVSIIIFYKKIYGNVLYLGRIIYLRSREIEISTFTVNKKKYGFVYNLLRVNSKLLRFITEIKYKPQIRIYKI